jgi:hypothetical protein
MRLTFPRGIKECTTKLPSLLRAANASYRAFFCDHISQINRILDVALSVALVAMWLAIIRILMGPPTC